MIVCCCSYGDVGQDHCQRKTPRLLIAQLPLDHEHSYFEIGNFMSIRNDD